MAASRVQCLRRILVQPHSGAISRLLSTAGAEPTGSSDVGKESKIVGKELA